MVSIKVPSVLVPGVLGALAMIPGYDKYVRVNFDEKGNAIIQAIAAFGVFILLIVVIFFVAQTLWLALPINNSSPFYYSSTFSTYIPTVLVIAFVAFIILIVAVPLAIVFMWGGLNMGGRK